MVPAQPAVFVSRASGKYDLYRIDLDGKNKRLLLAATGNEDNAMSVSNTSILSDCSATALLICGIE